MPNLKDGTFDKRVDYDPDSNVSVLFPAHTVDFIGNWEEALERRVQEAGDCLSTIRGVAALVLGGGIGKGEPWPLSDIDVIGVYRHDEFERTKHEVRKVRAGIEERWVHEGFPTSLDIRGIVFTDRETEGILAA